MANFLVFLLPIVVNFMGHTSSFGVGGGLGFGFRVGHERRQDGNGEVGVHVEKNVLGLDEHAGVGIGSDGQVNVGYGIGFGGTHDGHGQHDSVSHDSAVAGVEKKINIGLQGQADDGVEGNAQTDNHSHGSTSKIHGFGRRITSGFGIGFGAGHERKQDGNREVGVHVEKSVLGLDEQAGVGIGSDGQVNVGAGIGFGGAHDSHGQYDSDSHGSAGVGVEKKINTGLHGQADAGVEGNTLTDNHSHGSAGKIHGFGRRITSGFGIGFGARHERKQDGNREIGVHVEKSVLGLDEQAGVGIGSDGQVNVGAGIEFGGAHDSHGQYDSDSHGSAGVGVEKKINTGLQGQADAVVQSNAQSDNHSHGSAGKIHGFGRRITSGFGIGFGAGHERKQDGNREVGVHVEKSVLGLDEQAGVGIGSDGQVNVGAGIGFGGAHDSHGQYDSDSHGSAGVGVEKKINTGLQGQADAVVQGNAQSDNHSHGSAGKIHGFGRRITSGFGIGFGAGHERKQDGNREVGVHVEKSVLGLDEQAGVGIGSDGQVNVGAGIGFGGAHDSHGQYDSDSHGSAGVGVEKKINTGLHGQADAGVEGNTLTDNHSHGSAGKIHGFGRRITSGFGIGFGARHERKQDGNREIGVHVEKSVLGLDEQAGVGIGSDGQVNVGAGIEFGGAHDSHGQYDSDSHGSAGVGVEKKINTGLQGQADAVVQSNAKSDNHSHGSAGKIHGFGRRITSGFGIGFGAGHERKQDGNREVGVHVEKSVLGLDEQAGVGIGSDGQVNVGAGIGFGGAHDSHGQYDSDSHGSAGVGVEKKINTGLQGQADAVVQGNAQSDNHSHGSAGKIHGFGRRITSGFGIGFGAGHERKQDGNREVGVHVEKSVLGLDEQAGVGIGSDGQVNVGAGIGFGGAHDINGQYDSDSHGSAGVDVEKKINTGLHGQADAGVEGNALTDNHSHGSAGKIHGFGRRITSGFGIGFGAGHERKQDGNREVGVHVEKSVLGLDEQVGVGIGSDGQVNVGSGIGFGGAHDSHGQYDSDSHGSAGVGVEKKINTGLQGQADAVVQSNAKSDNHSHGSAGKIHGFGRRITSGFGIGFGAGHERKQDGNREVGVHVEKSVLGLDEQAGVGIGSDGQVNVGAGIGFGGAHDSHGQYDSDSHGSAGVGVEKKINTGLHGQADAGVEGNTLTDNHSHGSAGKIHGFGRRITSGFGIGFGARHERKQDGNREIGVHVEKSVLGLDEQAGVGIGSDGQVNVGAGIEFGGAHDSHGQYDSDSHGSAGVGVEKKINTGLQGQADAVVQSNAKSDNHSHGSAGKIHGFGRRITSGFGIGFGAGHERKQDGNREVGVHVEKSVLGLDEQAGVGIGSDGQVNVGAGIGFGGAHDSHGQYDSDSHGSAGVGVEKKINTGLQGQADAVVQGNAQSDNHSHGSAGKIHGFGRRITSGFGIGFGAGHERKQDGNREVGVHVEKSVLGLDEQAGVGIGSDGQVNVGAGIGFGGAHDINGQYDSDSHGSAGVDVEKKINTGLHGQADAGVEGNALTDNHSHGSAGKIHGFGRRITSGFGIGFGAGHERKQDGNREVGVHVEKSVLGLDEQVGVGIGSDGQVNVGSGIGFGGAHDSHGQYDSDSHGSAGVGVEKKINTGLHGQADAGVEGNALTDNHSHGSAGKIHGFGRRITSGFGIGFGAGHERKQDGNREVGVHVEKSVLGLDEQAGVGIGSDGQVNVGADIGFGGAHDSHGQYDSDSHGSAGVGVEKKINTGLQGQADAVVQGNAQSDNHSHGSAGKIHGFGRRITSGFGIGFGAGHERKQDGNREVGVHVEKSVLGLDEQAGVGIGSDGQVNVGAGIGFGAAHDINGQYDSDSHGSAGVGVEKKINTGLHGQADAGVEGNALTDNHSHGSAGKIHGFGRRITSGFGIGFGAGHERKQDGNREVGVHVEKSVLGLDEQVGVGIGSDGQVNVGSGIGFGGAHDSHGQYDIDSHGSAGVDVEKKINTGLQGQGDAGVEGNAQTDNHSHGISSKILGFGRIITSGFGIGFGAGHERKQDGNREVGVHVEKSVLGLDEQAGVGIESDGQVNVGSGIGFGGAHDGYGQYDSDSHGSAGVDVEKKINTGLQGQADAGVEGNAQTDNHSHGISSKILGFGRRITSGFGIGFGAGYERKQDGNREVGVHVEKSLLGLDEQAGVGIGSDGQVNVASGIGFGGAHDGHEQHDSDSHRSAGFGVEKKINTGLQGQADAEVDGNAQTDSHSHGSAGKAVGFGKRITGGFGIGFGAEHEHKEDGNGEVGVHVEKSVLGLDEQAGVGISSDGQVNVGFDVRAGAKGKSSSGASGLFRIG